MTPLPGTPYPYNAPRDKDAIQTYMGQMHATRAIFSDLTESMAEVIGAAFPAIKTEVLAQFQERLETALCYSIDSALASMQNAPRSAYTPEYLVQLTRRRDELESRINQAEESSANVPEELRDYLKAILEPTIIHPMRQELENVEEQLSAVQRDMEKAEAEAHAEANQNLPVEGEQMGS